MKKNYMWACVVILALMPFQVYAGGPMETTETEVKKILAVLGDPSLTGEAGTEAKKEKLRAIFDNIFYYVELSKRTLGRNWKKLDNKQRDEFVKLYRKLLDNVYMDRLLAYKDEKVIFSKESMISEKRAEVFSNIDTGDKQIPINYRLILKENEWKVYDIIIEGVSLVKNYRSQFNSILVKNEPEELLKILREKTG
ncbi:MAG: ABC transporter substrate-binding protein [Desulfobacterales bacterium]|nr:MAG: ABC transporter substrate-binding protein [Desulfobacterales bacterium]